MPKATVANVVPKIGATDVLFRLERLVSTFRGHPFEIGFERTVSRKALAQVANRKAEHDADSEKFGDSGEFDAVEILSEAVDAIWKSDLKNEFQLVKRQLDQEVSRPFGYDDRCAERLGDGFNNMVESSDWLTAMNAQVQAIQALAALSDLSPGPSLVSALDRILAMADIMRDAMHPLDGGEEPFLLPATRHGLAELVPLLAVRNSGLRHQAVGPVAAASPHP